MSFTRAAYFPGYLLDAVMSVSSVMVILKYSSFEMYLAGAGEACWMAGVACELRKNPDRLATCAFSVYLNSPAPCDKIRGSNIIKVKNKG
jgi:hypothetical protein